MMIESCSSLLLSKKLIVLHLMITLAEPSFIIIIFSLIWEKGRWRWVDASATFFFFVFTATFVFELPYIFFSFSSSSCILSIFEVKSTFSCFVSSALVRYPISIGWKLSIFPCHILSFGLIALRSIARTNGINVISDCLKIAMTTPKMAINQLGMRATSVPTDCSREVNKL